MRKWESEDEWEKQNPRMRWRRGEGEEGGEGRRRFVWIFFSLSIFSRSLSVVRVHALALRHDDAADAADVMVAMSWNERTGKKCYIQVEDEEEGGKKYTYSQFSLWNKSHTFFSTIICMFSEAPWMLYVLPHFLSMDITWRNIHVYKFCSLYHSWTLLNTKKWARNINIVIEWIDKRAFLPLLRWLHTSEWIEDFWNRQINCWKKTWEIFRMRLGSETIR